MRRNGWLARNWRAPLDLQRFPLESRLAEPKRPERARRPRINTQAFGLPQCERPERRNDARSRAAELALPSRPSAGLVRLKSADAHTAGVTLKLNIIPLS